MFSMMKLENKIGTAFTSTLNAIKFNDISYEIYTIL